MFSAYALVAIIDNTQKKLYALLMRAQSVSSNIGFKPASHWVGHQKDGVITEATDGQCVRSGRTSGRPRSKLNTWRDPRI